jgi:ABC-type transporter Mla subunit MlaD
MVSATGGSTSGPQQNDILASLLQQAARGGDGAQTENPAVDKKALATLLQKLSSPKDSVAEEVPSRSNSAVPQNRLPQESSKPDLAQLFSQLAPSEQQLDALKNSGSQIADQVDRAFQVLVKNLNNELKTDFDTNASKHRASLEQSGFLDKLVPDIGSVLEAGADAIKSVATNLATVFSNNKPAILDAASKFMTIVTQVAKQQVSQNPIAMSALAFNPSDN